MSPHKKSSILTFFGEVHSYRRQFKQIKPKSVNRQLGANDRFGLYFMCETMNVWCGVI